jgi:predicted neutral ceramidase superfamily lipid hydrolase
LAKDADYEGGIIIEIMSEVTTSTLSKIEQHPIGKSVFLHFMPALIWLIFYVPFTWIANQSNIPSMLIMYVVGA